ncbi:MAG: SIR2 family protein [Solirubrobacterales bacterium]
MTVTAFINYRRAEAAGWARLLYERLAKEFGEENVFLDQVSLEPGVKWLQGIRSGSAECTAFVSLLGPQWATTMTERAEGTEEDFVRSEIETALEKGSGVQRIFPVLVEGAQAPRKKELRYLGSIQPLLNRQLLELRPSRWDDDVEILIGKLKQPQAAAAESAPAPAEPTPPPAPTTAPAPPPAEGTAAVASPDQAHYEELAHLLREEGSLVVPFLGPGANSCDRTEPWEDVDSRHLPDSDELAAYLASRLGNEADLRGLAGVSQSLSVAKGPGDLYMALRRALPPRHEPGSVHRFLAELPAALQSQGAPDRYGLIVTTNYDNALERAFEEAEEGYDLAVYLARGRDKGRFVHIPCDGAPQLVTDPNAYTEFPIDAFGRVERTVIMKVHGAIDRPDGPHAWRDNYVITEDDYIDYMSDGEIESIVPQQLLGKLRDYSHFLFLGHEMHDWSLRVFLLRIFGDRGQPNTSWAVQREPSKLDERFWQRIGVDLAAIPLDVYVKELGEHLKRLAAPRAQA